MANFRGIGNNYLGGHRGIGGKHKSKKYVGRHRGESSLSIPAPVLTARLRKERRVKAGYMDSIRKLFF